MLLAPYIRKQNDLMNFNPFRAFEQMERSFFSDNAIGEFKTDIRDAGSEFILEADLPGFKKDDLQAELKDGYLTISAETTQESEEKDEHENFVRKGGKRREGIAQHGHAEIAVQDLVFGEICPRPASRGADDRGYHSVMTSYKLEASSFLTVSRSSRTRNLTVPEM